MNSELDKQLCEKYPKIFANRYGDMRETAMVWGFDVGDGWYNIIDALCANIQGRIDWREKTRKRDIEFNEALQKALDGDKSALIEYHSMGKKPTDWHMDCVEQDLERKQFRKVEPETHQVVAAQVKEKFGTLRFYINAGDDVAYALVSLAESMSARTCETCGSPGKSRGRGWIYVACDEHTCEEDKEDEDD